VLEDLKTSLGSLLLLFGNVEMRWSTYLPFTHRRWSGNLLQQTSEFRRNLIQDVASCSQEARRLGATLGTVGLWIGLEQLAMVLFEI
jgi:hypothetical protein